MHLDIFDQPLKMTFSDRRLAFSLGGRRSGFFPIFLLKLFHASGGVDKFLLAGEKAVAGRANLHLDVLYRGAGVDHIATGAGDRSFKIVWMYTFFHE